MAKIVETHGSGITETAVVRFDPKIDLKAIVAAANHTMALEQFSTIAKLLGATANNILTAANLPTNVRAPYAVWKNGTWRKMSGESQAPLYTSYCLALQALNVPPDSSAGYAAQVLILLDKIASRAEHKSDAAGALIYELGGLVKEATLKSAWEADAIRGEKIQRAAEIGDELANGSRELRREQTEVLKAEFRGLIEGGLKPMAAYRKIARRLGLDPKTVQRKIRAK